MNLMSDFKNSRWWI